MWKLVMIFVQVLMTMAVPAVDMLMTVMMMGGCGGGGNGGWGSFMSMRIIVVKTLEKVRKMGVMMSAGVYWVAGMVAGCDDHSGGDVLTAIS